MNRNQIDHFRCISLTAVLRGCCVMFLGAAIALGAASSVIKGKVIDGESAPLPGATIKVLAMPDSTFLNGAQSDLDGSYELTVDKIGRLLLTAESFGAPTKHVLIDNPVENDTIDVPVIKLTDNTTQLADFVVTGRKAAVVAKQDTLEYNAGSFKVKQNAVVEDLLKRLPGVEVGADGSITSGGKSVTKILVDGEEFFSDDPKTASKNLPAEMIDKVQVLDRKSDAARLTGVDDGEEETVINLTVKKGMKNGWFGTVSAGYGTDDRYSFGFNISHFRNTNQITILGSANNCNDMTFTDFGRGRFRNFGGDAGITKSQSLGVNFSVGSSERLRFGGDVMYSHTDQDYRRRAETQYLFTDSTSYQRSSSVSTNRGHNVRADFRLQWNINDNNTLDFRPRFSFSHREADKVDSTLTMNGFMEKVNHQNNFQTNSGNSWQIGGDLIYSHKFASRPGRQGSVQMRYEFSNTKEKGVSYSDIVYYLMHDSDEELYRFIDNHQWANSVEGRLTWTEPIGDPANGNSLNFAYRMKYSDNNADKYTYSIPFTDKITEELFKALSYSEAPEGSVLLEDLSNRFRNKFLTQELQASFKRTTKTYNIEAGAIFSPSMSKSEDMLNPLRNIPSRWVYNVAPFLRFRYKFSQQKFIRVDYRARTTQPSLTQLQPVADESNPLNITVGNPDLKPTFTQTLMANYHSFDMDSQRALMGMIRAQHQMNGIVNYTVSNPETGARTTTYRNVSNGFSIMAMGMLNQPISTSHWRVNGHLMASYQNNPGYMNGDLNRSGNLMLRPAFGATYTNDWFQGDLRPQYSLQYTHNSLKGMASRTVHSYGFMANANLYLNCGLEVSTDLDFNKTSGYAAGFDTNQWLWNAQVSYSFLKGKTLTVALKVYDILQQKRDISRTVTATYISDEQVNALTRYAMLTLTYKFQTFAGKRNSGMPDFGGMDGPPGPPPGRGPGGHPGPPPR